MYCLVYPGARRDRGHRVLPRLPTKPYLTVREEYRRRNTFWLKPHGNSPLAGEVPLQVKIVRCVSVSHGPRAGAQKLACNVIQGPHTLAGRDVILLVFDPLHVALNDLLIDYSKGNPFYHVCIALTLQNRKGDVDSKRRSRLRQLRKFLHHVPLSYVKLLKTALLVSSTIRPVIKMEQPFVPIYLLPSHQKSEKSHRQLLRLKETICRILSLPQTRKIRIGKITFANHSERIESLQM
jgi:hypothetical protein